MFEFGLIRQASTPATTTWPQLSTAGQQPGLVRLLADELLKCSCVETASLQQPN